MAKLDRITGKIFGATADPTDDPTLGPEIGQFGSALAGTYNGTSDVATIQSLPAWSNGFIDAVTPTNQYPPLPEMTGFGKVLSYQQNYLLQRGMPEWDSATEYYTDCFCSYNGIIYKSLQDNNTNNQPDISPSYWEEYGVSSLQLTPFSINQGTVLNGKNNTLTYSGSTITCAPCTITTADGRTFQDSNSVTFDVSTTANGNYFIFKDYTDGSLSLLDNFAISNRTPIQAVFRNDTVLTNNNGVLSGFSSDNWLRSPQIFNHSTYSWEVNTKVTTGNDFSAVNTIFGSTTTNYCPIACVIMTDNRFRIYGYNSSNTSVIDATGTYTVSADTDYYIRVKFTGSAYTLEYSLDGVNYVTDITVSSSSSVRNDGNISFGIRAVGNATTYTTPFLGSIDFKYTNVKINNAMWWQPTLNWLDISTKPANLKIFSNNTYTINNNLVYMGNCTVSSGAVTALINNDFNATNEGDWEIGTINVNTSTAVDSYNIDLSNIIPKNAFNYLCVFRYQISRTDDSIRNTSYVVYNIADDSAIQMGTVVWVTDNIDGGTSSSDTVTDGGQFEVVLPPSRKILISISGSQPLGSQETVLIGYRRIGTNL